MGVDIGGVLLVNFLVIREGDVFACFVLLRKTNDYVVCGGQYLLDLLVHNVCENSELMTERLLVLQPHLSLLSRALSNEEVPPEAEL